MSFIIGKIDCFLNLYDIPNNYIVLDGRSVSKRLYPKLLYKINFSPKLYNGFEVSDKEIKTPDYSGYYLKQDKNYLGIKKTDTVRSPKDNSTDINGSFAVPAQSSYNPPSSYFTGGFSYNKFSASPASERFVTNVHLIQGSTDLGGASVSASVSSPFYWEKLDFNVKINTNGNDPEHSGDFTEPQNIGVIFAICASDKIVHYGLLYPDGTGKKYKDNTIVEVQDRKKYIHTGE